MIYNLSKYISNGTSYTPVTNGMDPASTEELFLVQTGGEEGYRIGTKMYTVQLLSRARTRIDALFIINAVYNLLANRFNIVLPAVTVDNVVHASVTASSILPLQLPGYIGANANGLHEWSVNFKLTL